MDSDTSDDDENFIDVKDWKEICHRDVHMMNIFVKQRKGAKGKRLEQDENTDKSWFNEYKPEEFPKMALADFDSSFFDLQSDGDDYADNPWFYLFSAQISDMPGAGGRYPPELFYDYGGHKNDVGEKITHKGDVWGLGQVMWNLVMNLPGQKGNFNQPFFDGKGTQGRQLNNRESYTKAELRKSLFRGKEPYEASSRYSQTLKDLIIECLRYLPKDRPTT